MEENTSLLVLEDMVTPTTKGKIYINLTAICLIWVFAFTAYSGLQNLESSLNPDIGVYSLAVITAGGLVSCILAPTVIYYIGPKGALILSSICLSIFIATNYYPETYILLPGAAIYGLSSGILWTAQGVYISTISQQYAAVVCDSFDSVLSRFFGIFCMAFQSTQIWGNLVSSVILQTGQSEKNSTGSMETCGANFCPGMAKPTDDASDKPDTEVVDVLISVYLSCSIFSLLITIFLLRPIASRYNSDVMSSRTAFLATLKLLLTNSNMALLVPLAMYSGMEQVVLYAEFTRAYVACELGLEWVGYAMICFGLANTAASPLNGVLAKWLGRSTLYIFATLLNAGFLTVLLFWTPRDHDMALFFIIPGAWAIGDAIWQTQNSALIGYAFPENPEAAFANLRMFEALGFSVAYLYSNSLCVNVKLYMVGGLLLVSVILVTFVEIRLRKAPPKYRKVDQ
ncbi:UNC93-like protein [Ylistrum balloti]|uniref:UNC93-like protein n=1 Tax=Ylistrum balloti TaxID=509963 RepID=UPI002905D653|nr:UNC93-like protein [Ylistrum balloti]